MKRCLALIFCLLFSTNVFAQLTSNPGCTSYGEPPLPAACTVTASTDWWESAKSCLNALVRDYPQYWPGATIAYQKDTMPAPLVYAKGDVETGLEYGDTNRIAPIASMTKPIVYAAGLELIQDHMEKECKSPDGTIPSTCIFPHGVETRLNTVLLRLDRRNGTNILGRWFNNNYLGVSAADRALYDDWKYDKLRIKHLFAMSSGFPPLDFRGHWFCDTDACGAAKFGDVSCARSEWDRAQPHATPCGYSRMYNRYLELRGGSGNLPDTCRPRPVGGPRLFNFATYYGGAVYDSTRMAQQFERRYTGSPYVYDDCIYTENANGTGSWINGRATTTRNIALFSLGLPLKYEPGKGTSYAQANLYTIALLIEELSGLSFNAYVKQQLLDPIGMYDTFFVPEKDRPSFAPGGANHFLSHGSRDPNDHRNDEGGTPSQYARILDVKRVPTTPRRVIADIAPGLWPNVVVGPDRNWDEGLHGWKFISPEGGAYSTARDVLKFLRFAGNGLAANGSEILTQTYRDYLTKVSDTNPLRTYGFEIAGPVIGHSGLFGGIYQRNKDKGLNTTVLASNLIETPHGAPNHVPPCEFQYNDRQRFQMAIEEMLQKIP